MGDGPERDRLAGDGAPGVLRRDPRQAGVGRQLDVDERMGDMDAAVGVGGPQRDVVVAGGQRARERPRRALVGLVGPVAVEVVLVAAGPGDTAPADTLSGWPATGCASPAPAMVKDAASFGPATAIDRLASAVAPSSSVTRARTRCAPPALKAPNELAT